MNLKQAEEKLEAKQNELGAIYAEAKDADGRIDLSRVEVFKDIKGTTGKVEKLREMETETTALAKDVEALREAEASAKRFEDDQKAASRPPFPGKDGAGANPDNAGHVLKSLGEIVTADAEYQKWVKSGAAGGINFNFPDRLPSDFLSKYSAYPTMGSKTLMETTAGWAPESVRIPGFVEAVTRPIQLLDIIPMAQTGMEQVVYMEETTRTHAAAEKAEGATFAESTFAFTEQTSSVRKITDSLPVTDEQLEDVAQAQSYINGRLTFGLRQRLDSQCLVGNGTAPNLRGIKNVSGIQTQAKGTDPTPDAFFKAMTKIRLTGRATPTHHVIHPSDWEAIRLLRTADGVYIWGNPSESGPERMFGLPVVQCDADSAGTGYVGSFQPAWVSLFERRGVDVQVGYVGTQFGEGKRTVRADMRYAFVVFRPAAFCTVTGI